MTYYLFDSKGFVGDLASIHGLFELREFLSGRDDGFREFFDKGFTEDPSRFSEALTGIVSDDEMIQETLLSLNDLIIRCRDIAIINDAVETEEYAARKKEIQERYALPRGKRRDIAMRRARALELYRPLGRRALDFTHTKLAKMAAEMGGEMTRGNHPFDLVIGDHLINFVVYGADELDEREWE